MKKVFAVSVQAGFRPFGSLRSAKSHVTISTSSNCGEKNFIKVKFMNHWQRTALFSIRMFGPTMKKISYNKVTMGGMANQINGKSVLTSF